MPGIVPNFALSRAQVLTEEEVKDCRRKAARE